MSLETNLRYENMCSRSKTLTAALTRQQERIKYDELIASREKASKEDTLTNLKSEWSESLAEKSENLALKNNAELEKGELILANKAFVKVRRAALRERLEKEHQQYESELHQDGKTFYIQRM